MKNHMDCNNFIVFLDFIVYIYIQEAFKMPLYVLDCMVKLIAYKSAFKAQNVKINLQSTIISGDGIIEVMAYVIGTLLLSSTSTSTATNRVIYVKRKIKAHKFNKLAL